MGLSRFQIAATAEGLLLGLSLRRTPHQRELWCPSPGPYLLASQWARFKPGAVACRVLADRRAEIYCEIT